MMVVTTKILIGWVRKTDEKMEEAKEVSHWVTLSLPIWMPKTAMKKEQIVMMRIDIV